MASLPLLAALLIKGAAAPDAKKLRRLIRTMLSGLKVNSLTGLAREIDTCTKCPRLREHCQQVAQTKRRAYMDWDYWGRPVPSFGSRSARLLIVGLAPGAHGANRTGRMFTGDSSGDFLYSALHAAGFASQPTSVSRNDGLLLQDAYITAAAHCAPPGNKPTPAELATCREFLTRELLLLTEVRVVVVLGRIAHENYLRAAGLRPSAYSFGHDRRHALPAVTLLCSYHPSQQNTSTRRLTREMLLDIFHEARRLIHSPGTLASGISV
jgi:uracil-DNA glycosylase family 4